jgi:NAD(P)-dependent dehydrogenase (short-subunit alcohol dehydrogenase family)
MNGRPVVILTGASRGLGAATALWLGKMGAAVVLAARSAQDLARVAAQVEARGGQAAAVAADVARADHCRRLVEEALERFGRLDALINNAALVHPLGFVAQVDPEAWACCQAVNVLGPFHLAQAALPALRESQGRIIMVSTGAASKVIEGAGAYCVSKAALLMLARVLAAEEPRVTTLSVAPGVVDTPMQEALRREGEGRLSPSWHAYFSALKEEGKLEPPEVPGRVIAWLSLCAPRDWSGAFLRADEPRLAEPARQALGDSL